MKEAKTWNKSISPFDNVKGYLYEVVLNGDEYEEYDKYLRAKLEAERGIKIDTTYRQCKKINYNPNEDVSANTIRFQKKEAEKQMEKEKQECFDIYESMKKLEDINRPLKKKFKKIFTELGVEPNIDSLPKELKNEYSEFIKREDEIDNIFTKKKGSLDRCKSSYGITSKSKPEPQPEPEPKPEPVIELTKPQEKELEKLIEIYEEQKEEPKIEQVDKKIVEYRSNYLNDVIDILGNKKISTRAFNQFEKKYKVPSLEISTLVNARNSGFFPTSVKCLDSFPIIKKIISDSASNMLEPTMGLGSMIDYAYNINPELNITGIEWNPNIFQITKRLFPDKHIKLEEGDFLQKNFDNNEFDLILMNPPFAWDGDSRYFVDFIFKALNVMKKSTQKCNMILICPSIINKSNEIKKNPYYTLSDLILNSDAISYKKFNKILSDGTGYNITKKEYDRFKKLGYLPDDDEGEASELIQKTFGTRVEWQELGECKDFGGTGIRASVYLFRSS
jgi:hypothetical protein